MEKAGKSKSWCRGVSGELRCVLEEKGRKKVGCLLTRGFMGLYSGEGKSLRDM